MEAITETLYDVVSKKINIKQLTYSLSGIILCIAVIYTAILFEGNLSSTMYMLVVTLGVIGAITFLIKLIFGSNQQVYEPTKCEVKNYSFYFKSEETLNLIHALEKGNISIIRDILGESKSSVKLDIIVSKDEKFAACQIFKYVPYDYEPDSIVYRIDEKKITELHQCMQNMSQKNR